MSRGRHLTPWRAGPWPLVGDGKPDPASAVQPSGWAVYDHLGCPVLETSSQDVAHRVAHAVNLLAEREQELREDAVRVAREVSGVRGTEPIGPDRPGRDYMVIPPNGPVLLANAVAGRPAESWSYDWPATHRIVELVESWRRHEPAPLPAWDGGVRYHLDGQVVRDGEGVVAMTADVEAGARLVDELNARDVAGTRAVRFAEQRHGDLVGELRRHLASLEGQLAQARERAQAAEQPDFPGMG